MNVPAYATIDKPKARPPPLKDQACIEFLYACFHEFPGKEIIARANRMREAKVLLEQR